MIPHDVGTVFSVVDLAGVVLNGIIGGTVARNRHFDVVGFVLLAIVSALGGGIVRDVLLDTRPLALTTSTYLECAILGAAIAYVIPLRGRAWATTSLIFDALAVGAWAAAGTSRSLQFGVGWLPAVFLGLATAIGGGTIRDVAVGSVPAVFGGNRLYAIPAALAAVVVVGVHATGGRNSAGLVAGTVVGAALVILAHVFGWSVPTHGDGTLTTMRERLRRTGRRSSSD